MDFSESSMVGRKFSTLEKAQNNVIREYREKCMLERNRYLVDYATCLLAVYNDEWWGGMALTVRCA